MHFLRPLRRRKGISMTTTIFSRETRNEERFGGINRNLLRVLAIGGVIFIAAMLLMSVFRVTRINAGYVGVEVNLAGSQRGAQDIPVRTGWIFYSPLKTQVIEFPTFVQTVKWTADINEGHPYKRDRRGPKHEARGDCGQPR